MKRVEILEDVLIGTRKYYQNDTVSIEDDEANIIISMGWGKDVETGYVGDRIAGARELIVDSVLVE